MTETHIFRFKLKMKKYSDCSYYNLLYRHIISKYDLSESLNIIVISTGPAGLVSSVKSVEKSPGRKDCYD